MTPNYHHVAHGAEVGTEESAGRTRVAAGSAGRTFAAAAAVEQSAVAGEVARPTPSVAVVLSSRAEHGVVLVAASVLLGQQIRQ